MSGNQAPGAIAIVPDHSSPQTPQAAPPGDGKMSRFALTMAWGGTCSALFFLILPATLAMDFGTGNALAGTVIAVIVIGLLTGQMVRHSVRLGAASSAISQELFGRAGGAVPTLILCITGIWYAVFEGSVLALAASKVLGISYSAAVVLVVLYSAPMSVGSVQTFLDKANGVLLPFYLLGLVLLVALTLNERGYSNAWLRMGPPEPPSHAAGAWWDCFSAYLGLFVMVMISTDYAQFGRPRDARFLSHVSFGIPFFALTLLVSGLVAIFIVGSMGLPHVTETSVIDACLDVLGPAGGLAWIFVTQTRINTANYYISTVNLQSFLQTVLRRPVRKVWCAAAVGVATLVFMLSSNVFQYILVALSYQGVLITAWVGMAFVHLRAAPSPPVEGRAGAASPPPAHGAGAAPGAAAGPAFNARGMGAWLAGVLCGLVLLWIGGLTATFSAPVSMVVSAACLLWQRRARGVAAAGAIELKDVDVDVGPAALADGVSNPVQARAP